MRTYRAKRWCAQDHRCGSHRGEGQAAPAQRSARGSLAETVGMHVGVKAGVDEVCSANQNVKGKEAERCCMIRDIDQ